MSQNLIIPRLGVNIDHVATLRQARGENYPSLVQAAKVCLTEGADQITIHLREDRRHIQDTDVGSIKLVTEEFQKPLNLEMGCNQDILEVALNTKPAWICLVPEKREERTTEGGLDLITVANFKKVMSTCERLKAGIPHVKISLFVEGSQKVLTEALKLPADAVEIHTGDFARAFNEGESVEAFLRDYKIGHQMIKDKKWGFHAGHGLTLKNMMPLLQAGLFEEYNIGHWIICEAVFKGLGPVVADLKGLFHENR
ncbi:MAG: pyridoxine 5'-phosphate synthase [Bacteriovoracaceae bacterium]